MAIDDEERRYLEQVEAFTSEFGRIQRDFVLQKHGVQAILRFIEDFSGLKPTFKPDDPVLVKGQTAARTAIQELEVQFRRLEAAQPPPAWVLFQATLRESVRLQVQGYREMLRVFEDQDLAHLARGKAQVEQGMGLLEAGERGA